MTDDSGQKLNVNRTARKLMLDALNQEDSKERRIS